MSKETKEQRFQRFMAEQREAIDKYKYLKGIEMQCDPGHSAALEWVNKYAKKFRKEWTLKDFKESLTDLKTVRDSIQQSLDGIQNLLKIIDNCEERIICGLEDMEVDSDK